MIRSTNQKDWVDIRALLEPVSDVSGQAYFDALTRLMCERLGARAAVVGRLSDRGDTVQTLSYFLDGRHRTETSYPVAGTPCEKALISRDGSYMVEDRAWQRFPGDAVLKDLGISGYVGYTLRNQKGEAIGLFSALSTTPISATSPLLDFMKVAAPRTRAELKHEVTLNQHKEALSQALLLNYSKSMFMANISNELRTQVSAIIGYASLIRSGTLEPDNLADYAGEIASSGEGLLALISDILSLATMEISDDLKREETFDLVTIAQAGRRLIRSQAAAKQLTLLPVERTEPLIVRGDNRHTRKALMNLLTNAVRYTSSGSIEIMVSAAPDGTARISVKDTGIGMTQAELEVASRPLTAFAEAYDIHQEGAGLGLPLTALLMERQGGRLALASEKDKGTTAHLVFPKELISDEDGDYI